MSTNALKKKNDHTNVAHDKGAERPSTAITEDNIGHARGMGLLDRRVIIDDMEHVLQISHSSAYKMLHNTLWFHKACAGWVPKQLEEVHKQTRVDMFQKHLDRYGKNIFLHIIITGDEIWVHHYDPESKRQSMVWKHPQSRF